MEEIFESHLDGYSLVNQRRSSGKVPWLSFEQISNKEWCHDNVVLVGDAAHTTHFTVAAKLALEDAITLAQKLQEHKDLQAALKDYHKEQRTALLVSQRAAHNEC